MSSELLSRTQYTGRSGETYVSESKRDMEEYLIPESRMMGSGLHAWGVVEGFRVWVKDGETGFWIAPGLGLDAKGRLIALANGGFTIVDPSIVPGNKVTVDQAIKVTQDGVKFSKSSINLWPSAGDYYVTAEWLEANQTVGTAKSLYHAPWLRLVSINGYLDTGVQLVLAKLTLDADGKLTQLEPAGRRLVGVPVERVEFRRVRSNGLSVDQVASAELRSRADGGLEINLLPEGGGGPKPVLAIDGKGNTGIGIEEPQTTLHVKGNAGILNLEGTDHTYIQWYPDGFDKGRRAYIGFPDKDDKSLTICNENDKARVKIRGHGSLFVASKERMIVSKEWEGNGNLTVEGDVVIGKKGSKASLEVEGNVIASGEIAWGKSKLTTDQGGSLELNGCNETGGQPYIDFHFNLAFAHFSVPKTNL